MHRTNWWFEKCITFIKVILNFMPKKIFILVNVLGSCFFLFLCFIASPDWPRIDRMLSNPNGVKDFVFQVEMVLFFYVNFYFLLPKLYYRNQYLLYFVSIVVSFLLFVPITNILVEQFVPHGHPPKNSFHPPPFDGKFSFIFLSVRLYTFLLVFTFSFLLKILSHLREVKNQKLLSELELLKAQINPHFFFNTLNLIYSLSVENSPKTPDTILRLSSMMRYVLKDTKSTYIELDKELSYIQDYVEMQVMRLDRLIEVDFTIADRYSDLMIAPMILIPYIENAFKHGILEKGRSYICIKLMINGDKLCLHTSNTLRSKDSNVEKTHIGHSNSNRRLELLYRGKYELLVTETADRYDLKLELTLAKK